MRLPDGFIYLEEVAPTIQQDMRYFSDNNFVGRKINGYEASVCIITSIAAVKLQAIQNELSKENLGLKIFDAYRPQTAVNDFIQWSKDYNDNKMKEKYYPRINKEDLFKLNYIAEKSGHTRGSTIDLTIVSFAKNDELDMGTPFDYLDSLSHPDNTDVSREAQQNRLKLSNLMNKHGFIGIDSEWWHFTLQEEPFPDTYFDFPVKF